MNSSSIAGNLQDRLSLDNDRRSPYMMNSKIMVAAIVVLFLVVLFILFLHAYAKWFWRNSYAPSNRRQGSWRRRRRLDFAAQEGFHILGSIGLEKSIIDSLPTFIYEVPESDEEVLECAVCLCEFQEKEHGRLLPKCNHSFHTDCIDMWFHSHSTCPLCRTSARPDPPPAIQNSHQAAHDASSTVDTTFLLHQSVEVSPHNDVEANLTVSQVTESQLHSPSTEDWRRTNAERFHQHEGVRYPTNVLFWGDGNHVNSRASSPRLEQGQPGGRSMPHVVIDIPRRSEVFTTPRCSPTTSTTRRGQNIPSPRCPSIEEQSCSSTAQPLKSPVARMKSFKRLLSRERKVFPAEHDADCDQGETVSNI